MMRFLILFLFLFTCFSSEAQSLRVESLSESQRQKLENHFGQNLDEIPLEKLAEAFFEESARTNGDRDRLFFVPFRAFAVGSAVTAQGLMSSENLNLPEALVDGFFGWAQLISQEPQGDRIVGLVFGLGSGFLMWANSWIVDWLDFKGWIKPKLGVPASALESQMKMLTLSTTYFLSMSGLAQIFTSIGPYEAAVSAILGILMVGATGALSQGAYENLLASVNNRALAAVPSKDRVIWLLNKTFVLINSAAFTALNFAMLSQESFVAKLVPVLIGLPAMFIQWRYLKKQSANGALKSLKRKLSSCFGGLAALGRSRPAP